jgi:pro-apoptotic serine protease NMA111
MLSSLILFSIATTSTAHAWGTPSWEETIEEVTPAIVSIKVSVTRTFDTGNATSSQGTGFIVDAERGIILTNRHMVTPGPVTAEAVFQNNEEVPLRAIYRDPVHDFGFYMFDPDDVRFMDVTELALHPESANVGEEIRVIGNDEGEKISILTGTLARLDRQAPNYGRGYNDFNTFYIQAASSTSGGSSGSPVLNQDGEVVALNAGGSTRGASSFYLPLDRVVRALDDLQNDREITRGTLQTIFKYTPFDEVRRLGLNSETEGLVRETFEDGTGMLVVSHVLPQGPADGILQVGDIVTHVDGELVTTFIPLEVILDESVDSEVNFTVERGGESLELAVLVEDLHAITPDEYIEVGGSIFHPLSYQRARYNSVPVEGLYLAESAYMMSGIYGGSLITHFNNEPVPDLDSLWRVMQSIPNGTRVPVKYTSMSEIWRTRVNVIQFDRNWFPMERCTRNDDSGLWECIEGADAPEPSPVEAGSTILSNRLPEPASEIARSLVTVDFDIPFRVEGVWGSHFRGTGVILDTESGLVVTDRDTVPILLGDLEITIGGSLRVPAEVVWIHPTHNFAFIRYDPGLIGETNVTQVRLDTSPLSVGDPVSQVGLTSRFQVVTRDTEIARISALALRRPSPPHFRDTNLDVITLNDTAPSSGGVLADETGSVRAFWTSYPTRQDGERTSLFRGIPASILDIVLPDLVEGRLPQYRTFGAELSTVNIADARDLGLSETRAQEIEQADDVHRHVISISRLYAGVPAQDTLEEGDVILSIDGEIVTTFEQVERASLQDSIALLILRDGEEIGLTLNTHPLEGGGIERAVTWAGVLLHEPHFDLAVLKEIPHDSGIYVSFFWYGSPAARYGLRATRRIVAVDGADTLDLDSFLEAVADKGAGDDIRIDYIDLDGQNHVLTMKLDPHYWPTDEYRYEDGEWGRTRLD